MADRDSAVSGVLRRPFREQVAFFRGKLGNLVPTQRWDDITAAAHDTAFVVAGAQKADLLADLAASVDRAIAEGKSLGAFRKDFAAAVDRHDWHGWTGEDTKGGRAWRTRTIYRTNATVSYAAGRRAQLEAGGFKFWVYRHGGSKEPRPEHLAWDGVALPPDHPFWETHYPPSDWGCSCYVVGARTAAGVRRMGGDPDKTLPDGWYRVDPRTGEAAGIGKGWGYAPGASVAASVNEKVRRWEGPIAEAFLDDLPATLRSRIRGQPVEQASSSPVTSVDDLESAQIAALKRYTGEGYREINSGLREGASPSDDALIIDQVLERARYPGGETLYRGIGGGAAKALRDSGLTIGDYYVDKAFSSSSRVVDRAGAFREDDPDGILIVIRGAKGKRALYLAPISEWKIEAEVLIQREVPMKIVGWDANRGILEVEIDD